MPATYHIDPARRLVVSTFMGNVSDAEVEKVIAAMASDPAFDPRFNNLVDARAVTDLAITTPAIRQSAERELFAESSRRAFVVSDDAAYGVARMFQSLDVHGGERVGIFRDLAEAERWLGVG